MKRPAALLLCIFIVTAVFAQSYNQTAHFLNYNKVWTLGRNAGYDFNTHSGFYSSIFSDEGAAAVADPVTGQLLFYSDGKSCWNRNNQPMSQASGSLLGNTISNGTTAQGVCIVPFVKDPQKFYLFSLEPQAGYLSRGRLFYSVVDMSLNNGLGNVAAGQKNILMDSMLSEAMIAVPGNNCDVWLMVHSAGAGIFKAFHITASGIDLNPVISAVGQQTAGSFGYTQALMAASPNRQKIAITSRGSLVCDFDANTGAVSNEQQLDTVGVYGVVFSPDNTKLYISAVEDAPPVYNSLEQYDITNFNAAAIIATRQIVHTFNNLNPKGLKLYNDTIYVGRGLFSNGMAPFIDRVNHPNLPGASAGFEVNAVALNNGGLCAIGLPNDAVAALPPDTIHLVSLDTLICSRWTNDIAMQAPPGYAAYTWNDGSMGTAHTATGWGTYWVVSHDACHARIDTFRIRGADMTFDLGNDTILCNIASFRVQANISNAAYLWQDGSTNPFFDATYTDTCKVTVRKNGCVASDSIRLTFINLGQYLGKDTAICGGQQLELQAHAPEGSAVSWNNGSTTSRITVTDPGTYTVTVRQLGCEGTGKIRVSLQQCDCPFLIPNVFTPNNDGANDIFLPQWPGGCPVEAFHLRIFNRWGQLVFTSDNSTQGWDGTVKGKQADAGTYFYEASFYAGTKHIYQKRKGDITLVR